MHTGILLHRQIRNNELQSIEATVIATFSRRMRLRLDDGTQVESRIKGKKLKPVCGDRVTAAMIENESDWLITDILPRTNQLSRPNMRGNVEILAANVELLLVVAAATPEPDWFIVDRYLSAAESMEARAAVIFNKTDIEQPGPDFADYSSIGYNTISGSNAFSYDYGWDGAAIEIYGGRDNYIHHNIASDNDTFIELGESRSRGNIVAYNVVTSSLDTSVFLVTRGAESSRGPVTNTIADNNSVYLTGVSSQGFVCHGGCTPDILTLRNNIIEARWKAGYADGSFNNDYNVFHGGKQQFEIGPHTIVADPLWVNPDAGDLRLQVDSPAIDLGTPLNYTTDMDGTTVPIDGNLDGHPAPDAGAYERGAS